MLKNVKLRSTKVGLTILIELYLIAKLPIEEVVKLNKILLKKGNLKF